MTRVELVCIVVNIQVLLKHLVLRGEKQDLVIVIDVSVQSL